MSEPMTELERRLRELLDAHYSADFGGSVLVKLRAAAAIDAELARKEEREACLAIAERARGQNWIAPEDAIANMIRARGESLS